MPPDQHNKNTTNETSQRNKRGFEINGQWYFQLSDGEHKGPFNSEQDMLKELNEYFRLPTDMNQQN